MHPSKIRLPKIDKRAFSVVSSFEEAEAQDKAYWLSRTPQERLRQIYVLRQINYGNLTTKRMKRVLEVAIRDSAGNEIVLLKWAKKHN